MPSRRVPLLALLLLSACAAMDRSMRETHCHYDGAFESGMNDGRAGREMDSARFIGYCDASTQAEVRAGYRDGYQAGLASRATEQPMAVRVAPHGRAFFCEVTAFGEVYAAFGATELEARAAARARCRDKQDEMSCRELVCRPNQ